MNGVLKGKVAVITGAGSGIAAAAARLFHKEGARIVLADVSGKEADLAAELGERVVACRADVSKSDDVRAMIDTASHTISFTERTSLTSLKLCTPR
ncbi:SDR family NAD(P)-dependent oxidoreductase [Pseudomonas sp. VE 196-7]|uniref:SDR family NAD(P)-dependent oxidoreductase n=1 Tax=Pseudomonas sp. VE 196-7 TaxID=2956726 RepID=UPI0021D491CF|nr:SDR family NAD(P)-dependent oxidoreductase [Pseudomonas sp. VE 196-7]MCU7213615.1 SDR family oxidoreductase [Pseudomonas sp. VE 196-7]